MSGVQASVPASLPGRSNRVMPSSRMNLAKSAAAMAILALIPLVAWLTWQSLGGIRATPANEGTAARANAMLEQSPTGAGLSAGNAVVPGTSAAPGLGASASSDAAGTQPIMTAGVTPSPAKPAAAPTESASQAQGPKGAILIKGLGFLTIDPPAADKPEARARDEGGTKSKPVMRVSERPAAVPKGVDPCQDINRKLSTQDPTPEDIAFLKRGCR